MDEAQPKKCESNPEIGTKATITVEYLKGGHIQVNLDCHGQVKDGKPTVVASLALKGCYAIQAAIRDRFNVKHEHVLAGESRRGKTH